MDLLRGVYLVGISEKGACELLSERIAFSASHPMELFCSIPTSFLPFLVPFLIRLALRFLTLLMDHYGLASSSVVTSGHMSC